MQFDVVDTTGNKVGSIELPDDVFGVEPSEALLWAQVVAQRASRRSGTHSTKRRGEVSGGGIKPFKQKGTGRARQGSSRAPNLVGGGTVFGPKPRDYSYRLPRSARRAALRSALSSLAKEGKLIVVDDLALDAPSTKKAAGVLSGLGVDRALVVGQESEACRKSFSNLPRAHFVPVAGVSVYSLLRHSRLVITQAAIEPLAARARKNSKNTALAA